jgi:beta-phosphoglucomutase-like phosphatase (HAD superfamily)
MPKLWGKKLKFDTNVGADTEKYYTEVQEIILARYNKPFDWSLKAKMMGKKAIEAARVFVEETGISKTLTAEDFLVEREAMLQKLFPDSELMPGTILLDYITFFKELNKIIYIC